MFPPLFLLILFAVLFSILILVLEIWPWCSPADSPITRKASVFLGIVIALIVGYICLSMWRSHRAEQNMLALVNGDRDIRLRHVEIHGQQRRVSCSDPVVLRYLESRMCESDSEDLKSGIIYYVVFEFEDGHWFNAHTCWFDGGFATWIEGIPGEGTQPHIITLLKPVPAKLREIIDFLDLPYENLPQPHLVLTPENDAP